ncbi:hypothetical protein TB2_029528 [Malus domestica]
MQRQRSNQVLKIKLEYSIWEDHPSRVMKTIDDYFINLFTSLGIREWGPIFECAPLSITESMNESLVLSMPNEEIKEATMQIGSLKVPRPYGFQGVFYHSFWESIQGEVNELIRVLGNGEVGPCRLNDTHLVLIPKMPNPKSVSQFHLISLCNYSYMIFDMVLANRLKPLLPNLISPMHNAFVGGRQIQDNVGIAHELLHFLKLRKARTKFKLGIKLDMHKAYDRVEWDFLNAVMEKMGFTSR